MTSKSLKQQQVMKELR